MAKFRKKPVVIEAVCIDPPSDNSTKQIPGWLIEALIGGTVVANDDGSLVIKTLEGDMRGDVGDYLIQGVKGELYACKPDIFAQTYEPA